MSTPNQRIWDLYALVYDAITESKPYRDLLSLVVNKLQLKPKQKILDAGCGTGNLETFISDLGSYNVEIDAVDNNPGMLSRAAKKPLNIKLAFYRVDLDHKLPYEDNHFDRVVSVHVLYALQNPNLTLEEFFRVLKPNGYLILANPHDRSSPAEIMKANLEGLSTLGKVWLLTTQLPLIIINLIICRLAASGEYHFLSEPELRTVLDAVGFHDILIESAYAEQDLLVTARKGA